MFFLDTNALIEIVAKNPNFKQFLEDEMLTSALNIGEMYYYFIRNKGEIFADRWHKFFLSIAVDVKLDTIIGAMKFRYENKSRSFSYIDCIAYNQALENNAVFLTTDKAFAGLPNVRLIT